MTRRNGKEKTQNEYFDFMETLSIFLEKVAAYSSWPIESAHVGEVLWDKILRFELIFPTTLLYKGDEKTLFGIEVKFDSSIGGNEVVVCKRDGTRFFGVMYDGILFFINQGFPQKVKSFDMAMGLTMEGYRTVCLRK